MFNKTGIFLFTMTFFCLISVPLCASSRTVQPSWVTNPYSAYPRERFIAAVGSASDRPGAEKRAFAALVAFFGQSIRADLQVATIYSEAVSNGVITFQENTHVQEIIVTAAALNSLIGAEIGDAWNDGKGNVYALAYLEKQKAVATYTELIRVNQRNIDNLIAMSADEKNTFNGYARYKLAALLAGLNAEYAGIVSLSGGSTSLLRLSSANALTLETQNIIKNISIGFTVSGDQNNRVRDTFAKVLNAEGFRTQGANALYVLDININMSESRFPNNDVVFCRFTVNANLIEKATGSVVLPFSITDREGHLAYEEAQARSYLSMERTIPARYSAVFREYFASLMPKY